MSSATIPTRETRLDSSGGFRGFPGSPPGDASAVVPPALLSVAGLTAAAGAFSPGQDGARYVSRHTPYYPWFPKDFAADAHVMAMSNTQELIYRRLLDRSWELGPLPSDEKSLARLAGVYPATFRKAWSFPLADCWESRDDGSLINQRLEDERSRAVTRSEVARNNSQERWRIRSNRLKTNNGSDAGALRPDSGRNAIQTQIHTEIQSPSLQHRDRKKRGEETPARASREQCSAGAEPGEIPLFPSGVKWSKVEGKVEMLPDFRRWLTQHLKELSTQEGLHVELTPAEAQESWGRLNGHMLRNTHKTGKALPSIVVNWFENDLRRKAGRKREQSVRGRSKTANSLAAIDRWEERILAREAEEMDESICACPRDHETESLVTQGVREYCPDACGWSRLAPGISDGR